jgi:hypothetical protein
MERPNYLDNPIPVNDRYIGKGDHYEEPTYKIKKFNKNGPSEIIETGLTLAEARDYCNNPDTKGDDWFCGYERE